METLHRTKIYGNGVSDVLRQAEISAKFNHVEGTLTIQLDKTTFLTITPHAVNEQAVLKFDIESTRSATEYFAY